jgi:hypothetical protein
MNGGDLGVLEDLGAARPRTLGQRHGGVDRIGLAVVGHEHGADQVFDVQQRIKLARFRRRDHLHLEAGHSRHRGAALELLEAIRVGGDPQAAVLLEAGGLAGLGFQPAIEVGGVDRQLGQVKRRAQLSHQTGGMPGGAASELLAFQKDDVLPAQLGQVIGDRAADDAAADDDHPRFAWKLVCHCPPLP